MGTKLAPAYANLFMAWCEQQFLDTQVLKPEVWWRFLDDIFSIWTHGRTTLDAFLMAINNFHLTIKFTNTISEIEAVHLDTRVYVKAGSLETDLYVKPTNLHQYLHTESCHHTKGCYPLWLGPSSTANLLWGLESWETPGGLDRASWAQRLPTISHKGCHRKSQCRASSRCFEVDNEAG